MPWKFRPHKLRKSGTTKRVENPYIKIPTVLAYYFNILSRLHRNMDFYLKLTITTQLWGDKKTGGRDLREFGPLDILTSKVIIKSL